MIVSSKIDPISGRISSYLPFPVSGRNTRAFKKTGLSGRISVPVRYILWYFLCLYIHYRYIGHDQCTLYSVQVHTYPFFRFRIFVYIGIGTDLFDLFFFISGIYKNGLFRRLHCTFIYLQVKHSLASQVHFYSILVL
jgi:hypothetical protein